MENKNLVFYTNCQGGIGVSKLLCSKYKFKSVTYIETFKTIWNKLELQINILNNADIFIYQPINIRYKKYSTDENYNNNILTHLKSDCIKISFPYIYFACLFPLYSANSAAEIDGGNSYDVLKIVNRDIIIDLKKIYTNKEISILYDELKIDFQFQKNYEETIERIKEIEKKCNIKITNLFTLDNIKKIKLMHTNNHPTNYVLIYIANEIFKILNLPIHKFNELKNEILSSLPYSIYSHNYYNFDWIIPKQDCDEKMYKIFLNNILDS